MLVNAMNIFNSSNGIKKNDMFVHFDRPLIICVKKVSTLGTCIVRWRMFVLADLLHLILKGCLEDG